MDFELNQAKIRRELMAGLPNDQNAKTLPKKLAFTRLSSAPF